MGSEEVGSGRLGPGERGPGRVGPERMGRPVRGRGAGPDAGRLRRNAGVVAWRLVGNAGQYHRVADRPGDTRPDYRRAARRRPGIDGRSANGRQDRGYRASDDPDHSGGTDRDSDYRWRGYRRHSRRRQLAHR